MKKGKPIFPYGIAGPEIKVPTKYFGFDENTIYFEAKKIEPPSVILKQKGLRSEREVLEGSERSFGKNGGETAADKIRQYGAVIREAGSALEKAGEVLEHVDAAKEHYHRASGRKKRK